MKVMEKVIIAMFEGAGDRTLADCGGCFLSVLPTLSALTLI
jgi:hypothetical protein